MTLHNLSECRMPDCPVIGGWFGADLASTDCPVISGWFGADLASTDCPVIGGWFGADLALNGLKRENVLE